MRLCHLQTIARFTPGITPCLLSCSSKLTISNEFYEKFSKFKLVSLLKDWINSIKASLGTKTDNWIIILWIKDLTPNFIYIHICIHLYMYTYLIICYFVLSKILISVLSAECWHRLCAQSRWQSARFMQMDVKEKKKKRQSFLWYVLNFQVLNSHVASLKR